VNALHRLNSFFAGKETKFRALKIGLSASLIFSGNFFWFMLIDSFTSSHLLTNSFFQIILSFIWPILIFSVYLSLLVVLSIYITNKLVLFFLIFVSMVDYSFLTGGGILGAFAQIAISIAFFFFLFNLKRITVLNHDKTSIAQNQSTSFATSSIAISIILAISFYHVYTKTLAVNNILLTNQLLAKALSPIIRVYLDDLNAKNADEKFSDYLKRESTLKKISYDELRTKTLDKLRLTKADDNNSIRNLIKQSLNQSVLIITQNYKKQVPILISLGLAVIIQTIMSVSSLISNYLTWLLIKILKRAGFAKIQSKNIALTKTVSAG